MSAKDQAKRQMEKWTPRSEVEPGPYKSEAEQLVSLMAHYKKRFTIDLYGGKGGEEVILTPEVSFNDRGDHRHGFFLQKPQIL